MLGFAGRQFLLHVMTGCQCLSAFSKAVFGSGFSLQAVVSKEIPPRDILLAVLLVVGGCIIAGLGDFEFDLRG